MKRVYIEESWPDDWKYSYPYDLEEIYGEVTNWGYAYAYENRQSNTMRMISDALPPGSKILDIAAAQGNFALRLAEMGYHVTWNDLRESLADYVKLKYEKGTIEFAPGNCFELEFDSLFDGVLITEIIEHVAHPDDFLRKVAQLVRPGGYVILTTPNGGYFKNRLPRFSDCPDPSIFESQQFGPNSDGHIFLLHDDEVFELASQAGLTVESLSLFTSPLTNGHIKLHHALRVLPKWFVTMSERATAVMPTFIKRRALVQMGARLRRPSEQ